MSEVEQLKSDLQVLKQQNDFIIKMLKNFLPEAGKNLWMSEDEVSTVTGLAKRSLLRVRKAGKLNFRYAGNGRKIQYNRKEVEAYLKNNSTLQNNDR